MGFFSVIFGGFFKKLFGGDLTTVFITVMIAILALMALPTVTKWAGFFGYETKEVLREKLNTEKRNNAVLKDVVENDKTAIQVLDKTADNVEKTIVEKQEKKEVVTKRFDKIEKTRVKKIDEIQVQPLPDLEKIEKVSEANITSIWQAYCEAANDPVCQTIEKVPAS